MISIPSEREVVLSRAFKATRQLVFDALTTPDMLVRWYGPGGWSLVVCEIDLRVGGKFRFVSRQPDGKEVGQRGVYREIVAPELLINTESWEDWDPGETLVKTTPNEVDGKTQFTSSLLFPSQQVRDMILNGGLKDGASDSYDRLADCLASID